MKHQREYFDILNRCRMFIIKKKPNAFEQNGLVRNVIANSKNLYVDLLRNQKVKPNSLCIFYDLFYAYKGPFINDVTILRGGGGLEKV